MANLLRDCTTGIEDKLLGGITAVEAITNATDATAGNVTYAAAALLRGIIVRDGGAANRTDVFPTAALLVAALAAKYGQAVVGMQFDVLIVNGTATANTLAHTLGVGMTSGVANATVISAAIAQNASRRYTFRVTNVTPAAEAVLVYA